MLCFSFFSWYPIVREVIMSFQKPVYGGGYTWAGWSNYLRIFHDPTFWQAWRNTLEFTLLALVIGLRGPVRAWRSCSTNCGTRAATCGCWSTCR